MPTVVSISAKQKTAADRFGNTNFKRVGPNTAKNRQKDKKKSNVPYQGHGGHRMDLEQVRAMPRGDTKATISVAIPKATVERVKADARTLEVVRDYTLVKYGIEKSKRWAVRGTE